MLLHSQMIPLGTLAPDFSLPNPATGQDQKLQNLRGKNATVIVWLCNHCPYVIHIKPSLKTLSETFVPQGVSFIGINSNDAEKYPDDAPEKMPAENYPFPYLYDETQSVAREYQAVCTPDIFVFDADLKLVYRGQLDDSRPGNGKPLDGHSLQMALDGLLSGKPIPTDQKPSSGCSIKWK